MSVEIFLMIKHCHLQDMVSVETFIDYIKKNDIARIKFAIRESDFQLDARDEVSIQRS